MATLRGMTLTQEQRLAAFGRLLRALRGSRDQDEVAAALNHELQVARENDRVRQPALSAYERGHNRPNPRRLRAMERHWDLLPGTLSRVLDGAFDAIIEDDDAAMTALRGEMQDERRWQVENSAVGRGGHFAESVRDDGAVGVVPPGAAMKAGRPSHLTEMLEQILERLEAQARDIADIKERLGDP